MAVSDHEKNRRMRDFMTRMMEIKRQTTEEQQASIRLRKKRIAEDTDMPYSDIMRMIDNLVRAGAIAVIPRANQNQQTMFRYDIRNLEPYHAAITRTYAEERRQWILQEAQADAYADRFDHDNPIHYDQRYREASSRQTPMASTVDIHHKATHILQDLRLIEDEKQQLLTETQQLREDKHQLHQTIDRWKDSYRGLKEQFQELEAHTQTLQDLSELDEDELTRTHYAMLDDIDRFLSEPSQIRKQNIYHLRKRMVEHTSKFRNALAAVSTTKEEPYVDTARH